MVIASFPDQATIERLNGLLALANADELFLSVILPIPRDDVTLQGARVRLGHLMDRAAQPYHGTPWERQFHQDRARVEEYVLSLRTGGPALLVASSAQRDSFDALWLPWAPMERVRFGPGVFALPLIDLLDEWEPVAVAVVARDVARIVVFDAMRLEAKDGLASDVHKKHRAGGGERFQRHGEAQADRHLREAARELDVMLQRKHFHRWFIAGPTEAVTMFKHHLPNQLQRTLAGELSISGRATDEEVREKVLNAVNQVEREQEVALVRELEERAQRGQGAVLGVARTLDVLHPNQAHTLFIAAGLSRPATLCMACHYLGAPDADACPRCGEHVVAADLGAEIPNIAARLGIPVEIVRDEAAIKLDRHEGIGAFLKIPER